MKSPDQPSIAARPTPDSPQRRVESAPSRRSLFLAGITALATTLAAPEADAQHHPHSHHSHHDRHHTEGSATRLEAEVARLQDQVERLQQQAPTRMEQGQAVQAPQQEAPAPRIDPYYVNASIIRFEPGYPGTTNRPERHLDRRASFARFNHAQSVLLEDAAYVASATYEYLARGVGRRGDHTQERNILRYRNAIPLVVQNARNIPWQLTDADFDARSPESITVATREDLLLAFETVARIPTTPERQTALADTLNEGFESDRVSPVQATRVLASGLFDDQARMYERQAEHHVDRLIDLHRGFTNDEITILGAYLDHLAQTHFWNEQVSSEFDETQAEEFNRSHITRDGHLSYRLASHLFHFITSHHGQVPRVDDLSWAPGMGRDNGTGSVTPDYLAADFGVKLAQVLAAASAPLGYEPEQPTSHF